MRFSPWYKMVLLIWLVIGLPGLVLAYGFSGGRIASWFDVKGLAPADVTVLVATWLLLISPLWLAPFGVRRKKNA